METGLFLGFAVFLLAALCNGAFAFPQKFVKNFAWENTWGSFWFFAMLVIPGIISPLLVSHFGEIWAAAGIKTVVLTLILGALWGVGCITFGYAVSMIGLSLGFSIIMGIAVAVGSFLPLIIKYPEDILTTHGAVIITGIILSIIGVAMVGYAGKLKEKAIASNTGQSADNKKQKIALGMLIAVVGGATSACLNLGFAFAQEITDIAKEPQYNNPAWAAGLVSWILVFWGGIVCCGIFTAVLLTKNNTWKQFVQVGSVRNLSLTGTMGLLHFGIIFFYGVGAYYIGDLGTSLGYAAFTSLGIIVANVLGFLSREWKGAGTKPVRALIVALVILIISVCILGYGNSLRQRNIQESAKISLSLDLELRPS